MKMNASLMLLSWGMNASTDIMKEKAAIYMKEDFQMKMMVSVLLELEESIC